MHDYYACPHCECDLSAYAVNAKRPHIVCVSCEQRVAIAYDRASSRCVMCETGKTENGQPVFQKPELVDIRGEKLWRHKWVADQMFCTTCAVPPVPAEPRSAEPTREQ